VKPDDARLAPLNIVMKSFEEVLANSDVISIHMPSTPQTNGTINASTISTMRSHSVLINVGRGEIINEADLILALKENRIAGAALDVRAKEPPTTGEMETIPNLILTPHVAGITHESQLRITQILASNIQLLLTGKQAPHAVGSLSMSTR
jgi:D-3-phosphoglycerate dehydrogenase/(S)-sulfolactate dehydrogenase